MADPARIGLDLGDGRRSEIVVGPGTCARAREVPVDGLVADGRVLGLHGERLPAAWRARVHALPPGEAAKTWSVLGETLEWLAAEGLERGARIATFGGGAASDLGGLAAALYLRGVAWVSVPTTLLAMVDASVGGKTAVDLSAGKNLAGAFWQPEAVFADTELLATLPDDELRSGLGEVLKTALIEGEALLARLESQVDALLARDPAATAEIVVACVRTKARIVAADERESGRRAVLNLGHTIGHAIEASAGFGTLPHGVCVAAGLGSALELAERTGHLADSGLRERVAALAGRLGLPRDLRHLRTSSGLPLPAPALRRALDADKKRAAGRPRFVLPIRAGAMEHGVQVDEGDLTAVLG